MVDIKTVLGDLAKVASNEVHHVYHGQCPDEMEGFAARDPDCPACQAIVRAEKLVAPGVVGPDAFHPLEGGK